jgi:chromosome segregation ATPase
MNCDRPTLEAKFRELDLQHEKLKQEMSVANADLSAKSKVRGHALNEYNRIFDELHQISSKKSALMKQINEIK